MGALLGVGAVQWPVGLLVPAEVATGGVGLPTLVTDTPVPGNVYSFLSGAVGRGETVPYLMPADLARPSVVSNSSKV